jgi:hypothetical protein
MDDAVGGLTMSTKFNFKTKLILPVFWHDGRFFSFWIINAFADFNKPGEYFTLETQHKPVLVEGANALRSIRVDHLSTEQRQS